MPEIKPIEELEYSDDFMFHQVMKDDKICIGVLERLLKIKIDHIERVELEKPIKPYYQSKSVRLDVYIKDSDRVFDIEMQTKNYDNLPCRVRYYQSMIDANALLKGQKYEQLNESFIIFICKDDPVGRNFPIYTYLETCQEDKSLLLNDRTHKYFFNAEAADDVKDVELRAFLNYIKTGTASDEFTSRIDSIVEEVKHNEDVKELYLFESIVIQDAKSEGRAEGLAEGAQQKAVEAAINLLKMKLGTVEQIAQAQGLTVEKVIELKSQVDKER